MKIIEDILYKKNYEDSCSYFKQKYGPVKGNYFTDTSCRTINNAIKRENEGLHIHHIDSDKISMLSSSNVAVKKPFEFQLAPRLVYCNLLERLILNIKIMDFNLPDPNNPGKMLGESIVFDHLIPQLNDIYSGIEYKQLFKLKSSILVEKYLDTYLQCLEYLFQNFKFDLSKYKTTFMLNVEEWPIENNKEIFDKIEKLYKEYNSDY